jgi:serine carboxypeptidase-like clade 1
MLSGFVPVGGGRQRNGTIADADDHRRRLFWLLVLCDDCASDPEAAAKAPLMVYTTGGPGCSGLDAFLYEYGPFVASIGSRSGGRPPANVALAQNPHSWARRASVLYVDSPCGTGFSYAPGQARYDADDRRTVDDLVAFLGALLGDGGALGGGDGGAHGAPTSELLRAVGQKSPLYVAGESYAGVYVPMLVEALVLGGGDQSADHDDDHHATAIASLSARLRGYIVGNAVTDDVYDGNAKPVFAWGMNLLDPPSWRELRRACACGKEDGEADGEDSSRYCFWNVTTDSCRDALDDMTSALSGINPYSVLDDCTSGDGGEGGGEGEEASSSSRPAATRRRRSLLLSDRLLARQGLSTSHPNHAVACSDRRAARALFRSAEGRAALGIPEEAPDWEPCADASLSYRFSRLVGEGSMVRVHERLLLPQGQGAAAGTRRPRSRPLRALVLSGDHDLVVPVTGTRAWVYGEMAGRMRERRAWSAWRYDDDERGAGGAKQVGGFAVVWEGERGGGGGGGELTFATVKGAGHMAAQTRPLQTLRLLERWLDGDLV